MLYQKLNEENGSDSQVFSVLWWDYWCKNCLTVLLQLKLNVFEALQFFFFFLLFLMNRLEYSGWSDLMFSPLLTLTVQFNGLSIACYLLHPRCEPCLHSLLGNNKLSAHWQISVHIRATLQGIAWLVGWWRWNFNSDKRQAETTVELPWALTKKSWPACLMKTCRKNKTWILRKGRSFCFGESRNYVH